MDNMCEDALGIRYHICLSEMVFLCCVEDGRSIVQGGDLWARTLLFNVGRGGMSNITQGDVGVGSGETRSLCRHV